MVYSEKPFHKPRKYGHLFSSRLIKSLSCRWILILQFIWNARLPCDKRCVALKPTYHRNLTKHTHHTHFFKYICYIYVFYTVLYIFINIFLSKKINSHKIQHLLSISFDLLFIPSEFSVHKIL